MPARIQGLTTPFEANAGDVDARVAYVAQTFAGATFVTRDGRLVHSLPGPALATKASLSTRDVRANPRARGWALTETLVGARPQPQGGAASGTHVSRFVGSDPSRWRSDVPTFDSVLLGEAWPGIRVEVVARGQSVEKIFAVAPGADPRRIAIRVGGAKRLAIASDGALVAHTGNGPVAFSAPIAWQDVGGERRPVRVAYALEGHRYRFTLGPYDRALPLVIDPLLQATYLGGSGADAAYALAIAANGDVFVAGSTGSPDFPGVAGGAQPVATTWGKVFVAKLNGALTSLVQATYLGGSNIESAYALALDGNGNVLVAGSTTSRDFPGTLGGAQPVALGGGPAFVAKLGPGLTTLIQATYLGGGWSTVARAIALDASGNVFVSGETRNLTPSLPEFPGTAGGAQPVPGNGFSGYDGFVAKLNGALTKLVQATYLGGSEDDGAYAITIDPQGQVFVAGETRSPAFPGSVGGAQSALLGARDAFVAKLDNSLTAVLQSSYLGGHGNSVTGSAVALDGKGAVFVAGTAGSPAFPATAGGAIAVSGGGGFVARLDDGLTRLDQATFLTVGGAYGSNVAAMAVDRDGSVLVTGRVDEIDQPTELPATEGGVQTDQGSVFLARLAGDLRSMIQATYLGGWGSPGNLRNDPHALALDPAGNVVVAGGVGSLDFPGTSGGAQPQHAPDNWSADAFVAKLTPSLRRYDATLKAVEFHHAGLDHYFMTADADEIAGLDAHVYPPFQGANWERTGQSFDVLAQSSFGIAPVCRFFGAFGAVSSHFYTADPVECAGLTARFPAWHLEKVAYHVPLPDDDGRCPAGNFPVYRMYNNGHGGAPNHRFTTHLPTVVDFVVNRGWISEGSGPIGVAMCSPQAAIVGDARGHWMGATESAALIEAFVLDDGTYYLLYSLSNSLDIGGMIQGHGSSVDGGFDTTDAKDFSVSGFGVRPATLAADYVPGSSLEGDLTFSRGSTSFIAVYQEDFDHPASLAAAAGTYDGLVGSSAGIQQVTLTAQASGTISGSVAGCSFNGTATPRGNVDLFDLTITFGGGTCVFGTSTLAGFAYFDASTGQLLAFAPNASRTDSILFVGSRP